MRAWTQKELQTLATWSVTCDPMRPKKKTRCFKPGLLTKVWRNPSNEIDLRTLTSASLEVNRDLYRDLPGSRIRRPKDPGGKAPSSLLLL